MKKQLSFISKENGFFLPYVLFITSLIFILTTSNIAIYQNDLQITKNQIEQIRIETLFQMARSTFKANISDYDEQNNIANYSFPDGKVEILIDSIEGEQYHLQFTMLTKEQGANYVITNILQTGDIKD